MASTKRRKSSGMLQKLLNIPALILALFLVLIQQRSSKPLTSLRLRLSPWGKYAKWIDAMSKLESGNYTNTLARKYNNIFSMGRPYTRPRVNNGYTEETFEGQQMSIYSSYDQAIQDLILWLDYFNFPTSLSTVEEFVSELKRDGYFELNEEDYLSGLKQYL